MHFTLTTAPADIQSKIRIGLGEVALEEAVYKPLIDLLASERFAAKRVADLEGDATLKGLTFPRLVEALMVLSGGGHAHPVQPTPVVDASKSRTSALNRYICERATHSGDISFLASPVIGGGIPVPRFHQLFLRARERMKSSLPADWAKDAWNVLSAHGERLVIGGKAVEQPEQNLAELSRHADDFATKRLPILQVLQVVS